MEAFDAAAFSDVIFGLLDLALEAAQETHPAGMAEGVASVRHVRALAIKATEFLKVEREFFLLGDALQAADLVGQSSLAHEWFDQPIVALRQKLRDALRYKPTEKRGEAAGQPLATVCWQQFNF